MKYSHQNIVRQISDMVICASESSIKLQAVTVGLIIAISKR